jgi:hypothetical protein
MLVYALSLVLADGNLKRTSPQKHLKGMAPQMRESFPLSG